MSNEFEPLAEALEGAASLLLAHGNDATPPGIFVLAKRLRSGDVDAIVSTVSEATGGVGSLNDQTLSAAAANERLRHVIADIERLSRAAAAKRGISLVR